jgi:heterogeneous nuclear ribonucleoprotein F/H
MLIVQLKLYHYLFLLRIDRPYDSPWGGMGGGGMDGPFRGGNRGGNFGNNGNDMFGNNNFNNDNFGRSGNGFNNFNSSNFGNDFNRDTFGGNFGGNGNSNAGNGGGFGSLGLGGNNNGGGNNGSFMGGGGNSFGGANNSNGSTCGPPYNPGNTFLVHLRGMPYDCGEKEIVAFFDPINVVHCEVIYNNNGRHTGEADTYFATFEDAQDAMKRHKEKMGARYIELFFNKNRYEDGGDRRGGGNARRF